MGKMNYALILSGGVGTRMRSDGFPKQYLEIDAKPILMFTVEVFSRCTAIDKIVIVAAEIWQEKIGEWISDYHIEKFDSFALPGDSRQESIFHGLKACMISSIFEDDKVIIHDGVRPLVTEELIVNCLAKLPKHDGCIPVLPVTDTTYFSDDGKTIDSLLDRSKLFAGQAPEAFMLRKYYKLNVGLPKEVLEKTRGTSEIAFDAGFDICMIPGDYRNFKLTTPVDLDRFNTIIGGYNEGL